MKFDDDAIITHPDKVEQDWLYPSDTDYVFLGVFLCVFSALIFTLGGTGLFISGALFVACWWQLLNGRIYYTAGILFRNFWNDVVLRHNVWKAGATLLTNFLRPPPSNRRLAINIVGRLALIYNKRDRTDTLLVGGLGSDNTSYDINVQARIIQRVGEAIKRIASVKNYEVVVGFINMRRSTDYRRILEVYAEHVHWKRICLRRNWATTTSRRC
jgi:hypothetical protein